MIGLSQLLFFLSGVSNYDLVISFHRCALLHGSAGVDFGVAGKHSVVLLR